MNKTARPQRQKTTRSHVQFVQDLRRSNASAPIPPGTEYKRKPKNNSWVTEEDLDEDATNPYLWS